MSRNIADAQIETVHRQMLAEADKVLTHYHQDLLHDQRILYRWRPERFVWGVRCTGSDIAPLRPAGRDWGLAVLRAYAGEREQRMTWFLGDLAKGTLTRITPDRAMRILQSVPDEDNPKP